MHGAAAIRAAVERNIGRVHVGSATIDGEEWLRPCIVDYRTSAEDVRALVQITREVGAAIARPHATRS